MEFVNILENLERKGDQVVTDPGTGATRLFAHFPALLGKSPDDLKWFVLNVILPLNDCVRLGMLRMEKGGNT